MSRSDYLWFFSRKGINSAIEHNTRFLLPQFQSQHVDNRPRTGERLIDGVALQLHKQVWCDVSGRTARKRINRQQTELVIIFNHKVFLLYVAVSWGPCCSSSDSQALYQWVQLTLFYGCIIHSAFTNEFNPLYTSKNAQYLYSSYNYKTYVGFKLSHQ